MSTSSRTQRYIADILMQMSDSKKLSKISVTELCKECNLNRSTFYYHFRDIADVIQWIYHTEISVPVRQKIIDNTDPGDTSFITREILSLMYRHRDFYVQAIQISGQNSLEDFILSEAMENWTILVNSLLTAEGIDLEKIDKGNRELLNTATEYYCYAHWIVTINWMKRGMIIEPDKLAELMDTVASQGFDSALEKYARP